MFAIARFVVSVVVAHRVDGQGGNSSMVDTSCLTAAGCNGLGGCYSASTRFLKDCLVGSRIVDALIPHPFFLQTSCQSLGFKTLSKTPTGTSDPDPCSGGWASFFATDESLFWNVFRERELAEGTCPEYAKKHPTCFFYGVGLPDTDH